MTINDIELNDQCLIIHRLAGDLNALTRDGRELDLFRAYSDIELAARRAQNILNQRRWPGTSS